MATIMKLTELMPLANQQLTFITTDDCTASCPHCLMNCRPGLKHYLTFDQMKHAIDSFRARQNLRLVIFTGGEPTLLGEDLLKTIRYCKSLKILTRIVTNAHWASTPEKAEQMLCSLREAGLDEINMSMDDYHAPYVPIENIRTAWRAVKGKGFESAVLANCHGEGDRITPEYIQEYFEEKISVRDPEHRSIPGPDEKRAEDGTLYIIAEGRLQKIGRANDAIVAEDKYYQHNEAICGGCASVLSQPCVSFRNRVWVCCGVCCDGNPLLDLGSLDEKPFDELVDRGADSVLINSLHYLGPAKLWEICCKLDPTLDTGKTYHSICELCGELTSSEKALALLRNNLPVLVLAIRQIRKKLQEESEEKKDEGCPADTDPKA